MKQVDFKDFASLLKGPLIARKTDTANNVFKWHDVKWLCYETKSVLIRYKNSLVRDDDFKVVNFKRTGITENVIVSPITTDPLPISVERKGT